MLRALAFEPGGGWTEVTDLSRISEIATRPEALVWAAEEVAALNRAELDLIAREFGLHELALEDAVRTRQRPKIEEYEGHYFVVLHELVEQDGQLEPVQLACFIGDGYVLVLHDGAERTVTETERRVRGLEDVQGGSTSLMHTLLDVIVDDYQRIADQLEQEIESLEEIALAEPAARVQRPLYSIKQRVARIRRYVLPVSRVLDVVVEPARPPHIPAATGAAFRDVHDHTLRIAAQVRNVDDLADAVLDLIRSELASAQNEVTKRLTAWAAIIAVPTFVSSVYGMNFALVPHEGGLGGFWFALGLMAAAAGGLYVFFKRRRWI